MINIQTYLLNLQTIKALMNECYMSQLQTLDEAWRRSLKVNLSYFHTQHSVTRLRKIETSMNQANLWAWGLPIDTKC